MNRTPERTNFQPVKNSSSADVALNTAYIQGQFQSAAQPCLSRRMPVVLGTFTSRPRLFKRRIALSIGKNIIRRKSIRITDCTIHWIEIYSLDSLRSRSLEVVGERENRRAWGRHARGVSSRARFFLCPLLPRACYAGFPPDSVIHLLNNWTQFNKACRSVILHARLCIDSALWKSCNYWFPRTHNDAQWTCSSGTTHLQPCSGR